MRLFKFKEFIQHLNEGGNAVLNTRPIKQSEIDGTYDYIIKKILPLLKIDQDSIRPIGSFKKKASDQTSGDIDIAVSIDSVAIANGISIGDVIDFIDDKMKKSGYTPIANRGLGQVSIGVPIEGDERNGLVQVDLMLTDNLDFSSFMYFSPDFTKAESKYKGLYRNILLMVIISNIKREIIKISDEGEIEEYKSYVLRLNQGIVEVTKSFVGARGLLKTPKLLKDQDKFITNTPEIITEIAFGPNVKPSDIMTFEDIWRYITDKNFIHRNKLNSILMDFKDRIIQSKVPFPTEAVKQFPKIFEFDMKLNFKEFKLVEKTLPVDIDKNTVGYVEDTDVESIDKISRIASSSSAKDDIINFLTSINYSKNKAELLFDILSHSKDINKVKEYFSNRTLEIKDLIGKISNANAINQKLLGLNDKKSSEFFLFSWSRYPSMGPGEAYLATILKDGRLPSGKDKGDVIVGNIELEVKGSGARLVGQHGYGDGKQMKNSFKTAINNISSALNTDHVIIDNGDDTYWNITKTSGRGFEENLMQIAKLNKGFNKKDLLLISNEIVNAWKTYLINLNVKKYSGYFVNAIGRDGKIDLSEYNKILLSIFFEYYYDTEKFHYFCMVDNSGRFLIIEPFDFNKFYENGTIKIKATPNFSNSAGQQGANFSISI